MSILCKSGLMTHVWDLANLLVSKGVKVSVALKDVGYVPQDQQEFLISQFTGSVPYVYTEKEELFGFIEDRSSQILHAHSHAVFDECCEIGQQMNLPLIVTLHSVYIWDLVYSRVLDFAAKIIAVGLAQARSARRFMDKITVIENGIDLNKFTPKLADKEEKEINILWYGRVDGSLSKGIRALDRLVPFLPDNIQLSAIGSTDIRVTNIPMLGWIDDPTPYLGNAHITFAHSRSLREAMACGSIGFLLGHGYGGLVTEEKLANKKLPMDAFRQYSLPRPTVERIRNDILPLIQDPTLVNRLRQEARQIAENHFAAEMMITKTIKVYEEVLAS